MADRSIAIPPTTPRKLAATRSGNSDLVVASDNNLVLNTASWLSARASWRRTGVMRDGSPRSFNKTQKVQPGREPLGERIVEERGGALDRGVVLAVFDQPHYGCRQARIPDLTADRVSAVEEALGEGLIDHDHPGRSGRVAFGEVAAFEHPDAEQVEVARRNGGPMDHHLLIRRGCISLHVDLMPRRGACPGGRRHRDYIGVGHADYAGFRHQPLAKSPAEVALLLGRVARI